jgi:hypothetical protein
MGSKADGFGSLKLEASLCFAWRDRRTRDAREVELDCPRQGRTTPPLSPSPFGRARLSNLGTACAVLQAYPPYAGLVTSLGSQEQSADHLTGSAESYGPAAPPRCACRLQKISGTPGGRFPASPSPPLAFMSAVSVMQTVANLSARRCQWAGERQHLTIPPWRTAFHYQNYLLFSPTVT